MGLDNIPEPYPCEGKDTTIRTNEDKIDCDAMKKKGVCPVLNHNHPIGMLGTYCWFRGKVIASELEALGYSDLETEFYSYKSPDEIRYLIESVKEVHDEIKEKHKNNGTSIKGAAWNRCFKNGELVSETYSSYEDIMSVFEDAIKWLELLQENNCGFKAWY